MFIINGKPTPADELQRFLLNLAASPNTIVSMLIETKTFSGPFDEHGREKTFKVDIYHHQDGEPPPPGSVWFHNQGAWSAEVLGVQKDIVFVRDLTYSEIIQYPLSDFIGEDRVWIYRR